MSILINCIRLSKQANSSPIIYCLVHEYVCKKQFHECRLDMSCLNFQIISYPTSTSGIQMPPKY